MAESLFITTPRPSSCLTSVSLARCRLIGFPVSVDILIYNTEIKLILIDNSIVIAKELCWFMIRILIKARDAYYG